MTPVTGAVADAEQDRFILLTRPCERLRVPGVPVDRVLRMLQQIRTGLVRQAIRHHSTLATVIVSAGGILVVAAGLALYQLTSLVLGPVSTRQLELSLTIPAVEVQDLSEDGADHQGLEPSAAERGSDAEVTSARQEAPRRRLTIMTPMSGALDWLAVGDGAEERTADGLAILGGGAARLAAHAAALGVRTALVAKLGEDEAGRQARVALERLKVALQWLRTVPGMGAQG